MKKEMMNKIKRDLEAVLNCKVMWSYASDYLQFNIYSEEKQNDYKIITVKRFDNKDVKLLEETLGKINLIYLNIIYEIYVNRDYKVHKASVLENVVIDLIDKNDCEKFYIMDGKLCTSNQEFEWELANIKEFHVYDDEDSLIKFYDEYDECEYIVSFMHNEVIELS